MASGITPSLAVVFNALMDALSRYGVEHVEMPATPHRVWRAIQEGAREATELKNGRPTGDRVDLLPARSRAEHQRLERP